VLRRGEREREVGRERKGIAKETNGEALVLWVSYLAHQLEIGFLFSLDEVEI
jgi:hypothetical protein